MNRVGPVSDRRLIGSSLGAAGALLLQAVYIYLVVVPISGGDVPLSFFGRDGDEVTVDLSGVALALLAVGTIGAALLASVAVTRLLKTGKRDAARHATMTLLVASGALIGLVLGSSLAEMTRIGLTYAAGLLIPLIASCVIAEKLRMPSKDKEE